jgi:hypothetical protein
MIKYSVYTRDRWRGDLFDDLEKAIQYATKIAVDMGFDATDLEIADSLQNKRHWKSIDRDKKILLEPWMEIGPRSESFLTSYFKSEGLGEGADRIWIEPGGDIHLFEASIGCSRRIGCVDSVLRAFIRKEKIET